MNKKKIAVISAMVLLLLIAAGAAYLVYSRPMTIPQRYPMLTLEQCTEIGGTFADGTEISTKKFTVDRSSEAFVMLWDLFYEPEYRRSLSDLFPKDSRTRNVAPDDFEWTVCFFFEDVVFPDGRVVPGTVLVFQNWYGELDITFNGERLFCYTSEQEAWAKEIFTIIQEFS